MKFGNLVPMPARIRALPVDHRGFPVPYFVALVDGKPDHRVMDPGKLPRAVNHRLCWTCGQKLGVHLAFIIGPMCAINRTVSEPPSHRECAEYALKVCPFLSIPAKARREKNLPENVQDPAGVMLKRNPGALALWMCRNFRVWRIHNGVLFRLGDPSEVQWYAEGRMATRAEVDASIEGGLPTLRQLAREEGRHALVQLARQVAAIEPLLPPRP
jgi:hypothetical protein